ncbi:MAG: ABC transporter permease subunit [Gallicola sp.]|nr:ABC transporter permease subunit [Gallicola sp.]
MNVFFRDLKSGFKSLSIWTISIASFIFLVMIMFPEMEGDMDAINESFANMGGFTEAFGLDVLQMSTPMGFYGIESGNIIGIGGGMFSALLGVTALSKEEGNHTAEFLLSHPVKRSKVVTEKLLAVFTQILIINIVVLLIGMLSFKVI